MFSLFIPEKLKWITNKCNSFQYTLVTVHNFYNWYVIQLERTERTWLKIALLSFLFTSSTGEVDWQNEVLWVPKAKTGFLSLGEEYTAILLYLNLVLIGHPPHLLVFQGFRNLPVCIYWMMEHTFTPYSSLLPQFWPTGLLCLWKLKLLNMHEEVRCRKRAVSSKGQEADLKGFREGLFLHRLGCCQGPLSRREKNGHQLQRGFGFYRVKWGWCNHWKSRMCSFDSQGLVV